MKTLYTPKIVSELRQYSREKFFADLFAGATVGVIALPLAIAFAIASGLPPERGLFTAIIAGFIISLLGGSKVQIGGPTGAFVVIISGIVTQYGYSGLIVCTVMAGVILILFGVFRLGGLIKFIPFPVIVGFTSGIAVVIFSSQIGELLGLSIVGVPSDFLGKWGMYFKHLDSVSWPAAGIGLGTIVAIVVLRKWLPRLPGMLIAIIFATLIASFFDLNVATIGTRFGHLPSGLPKPELPSMSFREMGMLFQPALTIALLGAIESLLSASVADGMIGGRHRSNIELIAQGIANIGSVCFGGLPATGAIARTATNVKAGAKTPVAGITHAIVLFFLLLIFSPFANLIPLSALAGVLIVVSYNMSEAQHFASLLKGAKSDIFVLLLTFLLTILVDLTIAVEVGIVLSSFLFIRRISEMTNVSVITDSLHEDEDDDEKVDPNSIETRVVPEGVEVFEVNGPFFFGTVDIFKNAIGALDEPVRVLIIRIRNVQVVDATALHVLHELFERYKKAGTQIVFSGVSKSLLVGFRRSQLWKEMGSQSFCPNIDTALKRATKILDENALN